MGLRQLLVLHIVLNLIQNLKNGKYTKVVMDAKTDTGT